MTTPPTPAEVAEARTFLTGVETGSVESFLLDLKHSEVYRRHAAVLVRYAIACGERAALADGDAGDTTRGSGAAPAEQPREDDGPSGFVLAEEGPRSWYVHNRVFPTYDAAYRAAMEGDVRWDTDRECEVPAAKIVPVGAARSVSPSAVPAASAGGAGRDLTAQDIDAAIHPPGPEDYRYYAADYLNAIARPAATGTQATEQTTEYRVVLTSNRKSYASATGDSGLTDLLDTFKKSINSGALTIEQRSVSPWSPVAVHDENGAQA